MFQVYRGSPFRSVHVSSIRWVAFWNGCLLGPENYTSTIRSQILQKKGNIASNKGRKLGREIVQRLVAVFFFFVSVASAKCSFATASCIQVNSRYGTMGFWGFATAVFQESDAICWCSTRVFPKNLDYCRGVWSMLWFRLTMNLKKQRHPKNQAFVRRFAARFEIKDTKINEMSRQKMEVATVASWLLIRTCSNWESVYPMDPIIMLENDPKRFMSFFFGSHFQLQYHDYGRQFIHVGPMAIISLAQVMAIIGK